MSVFFQYRAALQETSVVSLENDSVLKSRSPNFRVQMQNFTPHWRLLGGEKNWLFVELFLTFLAEKRCAHLCHWPVCEWPCICACASSTVCLTNTVSGQNTLSLNLPFLRGNRRHGSCGFLAGLMHWFVYPLQFSLQKHKSFIHTCTRSLILSVEPSLSWGLQKFLHFFSQPGFWWKPGWGLRRDLTLGGQSSEQQSFSLASC